MLRFRRPLLRQAILLAAFGLLGLLALYHPLARLGTHLPTDPTLNVTTDFYHFHWNFWWIRHALTHGLDVYRTNYVLAPFTSSLALHTLSAFWYPVWALVEPLAGTVAAMTAVFAAAFLLNGYVFYHFLRREGVPPGWALVGGAMLELSPMLFSSVRWTNINLMGWFWLPLLLLTWRQAAESRTISAALSWALLLGAAVWAMVLTDVQYLLFAAFLALPYGLWTLGRAPGWGTRGRLVGLAALAAAAGLALLWLVGPLPELLRYDRAGLAPTPADRGPKIAFPLCFVWHCDVGVPLGAVALPGVILALALNAWARRRSVYRRLNSRRWLWLALAPAPLVLAAGADITLGGATLPMPYVALHNLLGGMFRYPERFGVVFLLPAATFLLLTVAPLARGRTARIWLPALLLLAVIADARLYAPTPLQPIPPRYAFYDRMGGEPYDYVVVEVPTAGSSGEGFVGDQRAMAAQFYGLAHGKRMVNGHISRVNTWHYWWMRTDDAMMAWLGQRRWLEPALVAEQMRERIFDWPIGYFVIHTDWIGKSGGPTLQEVLGFFNAQADLVCPVAVEGDAVFYRTAWHPDGCPARTPPETAPGVYMLDIGAPDDQAFIGWGWHWTEAVAGLTLRWTGEYPQARVYLDLPPGAYTVTLAAQAFWEPRRLSLQVNGQPAGESTVVEVDALHEYAFVVPAAAVGDGRRVTLTLDYDAVVVPAEVGQSADPRRLALAVDWIRLERAGR